jgi:Helix-turn-helix of DDE superfamily endonuclease
MSRAARSYRDANSNMGPCGPSHPCFTGIARQHLGELIAELADPGPPSTRPRWPTAAATHPGRAAGAGPHQRLVLCDRVLATLIVLRLQLPHQALAVLFGVDRATITRAIGQIRRLLAARGFAVPGQPTLRLRRLADVVAYAAANGVELRPDGTKPQVRRPRTHRVGRRAFISGKRKQQHPQAHRGRATAKAAPCGPGRCARAACTTRPRSTPRASPTC